MTRIVEIPTSFDDRAMDQFAGGFGAWPPEERLLFDARPAQWSTPYAFVAMLTAAQALAEAKAERPLLYAPASDDVRRYWARAGFFRQAAELFEIHGKVPRVAAGPSDTLLEVTPIRASEDVHDVVGRIQESAARILGDLGLESKATIGFTMALSEACQNIVEHAGTGGWVEAQAYDWRSWRKPTSPARPCTTSCRDWSDSAARSSPRSRSASGIAGATRPRSRRHGSRT